MNTTGDLFQDPGQDYAVINQFGYLTWPLEILANQKRTVEIRLGYRPDGWRFGVHFDLGRFGISEMPHKDQAPFITREDALERAVGRLLHELKSKAATGNAPAREAVQFLESVA